MGAKRHPIDLGIGRFALFLGPRGAILLVETESAVQPWASVRRLYATGSRVRRAAIAPAARGLGSTSRRSVMLRMLKPLGAAPVVMGMVLAGLAGVARVEGQTTNVGGHDFGGQQPPAPPQWAQP